MQVPHFPVTAFFAKIYKKWQLIQYQWLDGMPLYLPCVDPRLFAVVAQAFLELKFKDRALGFCLPR